MTGFFGPDDPPGEDGADGAEPRENEPEQSFADLVNELTGGKRHRRKKSTMAGGEAPTGPISSAEIVRRVDWPSWPRPRPSPQPRRASRPELDALEADLADAADAAIVRPYAWTRGRTKSTMDLRIEALVTTSELGEDIEALTQTEHRSVAELCTEPRSVAEVATLLGVPLGVAKVLLGDMANMGLVIVHKTATGGANKAHLMLMERVLSGLRRL